MLAWFHTLSTVLTGALILSIGLLVTTVAPFLVRRRLKLDPPEPVAKGAEESFKLFTSLTLLLLAFCLVRMQGDHRGTEDMVAREGTVIIKLDRAYASFGGDSGEQLRAGLAGYAKLVLDEEWPLLASGERGEKTGAAMMALSQASRQLEPKTPSQQVARSEILATFTQLSDLREARLSASRLKLPDYYWYAIACSMVLFTVFAWFQSPLPKLLAYVGGVTCGISLLLTILISTAGIFVGDSAVTYRPIARALSQITRAPPLAASPLTAPTTPAAAPAPTAPASR